MYYTIDYTYCTHLNVTEYIMHNTIIRRDLTFTHIYTACIQYRINTPQFAYTKKDTT